MERKKRDFMPENRSMEKERKEGPLLEIEGLKTYFYLDGEELPAVDDVSFHVEAGKTLAVIGESGSGKSVTALSIMKLVDPPGKILQGTVRYQGKDLLPLSERAMQKIRGKEIAMIYQDPMSTLNPMIKVGKQIEEAMLIHKTVDRKKAKDEAVRLMKAVGIADAVERYDNLPGQFSGGMRQRIMIAMAVACHPKVLIADEPTTALDVTIQSEILELLKEVQATYGMAILLNTHDLGVVAEMADDVLVMYCGKVMEKASSHAIFKAPKNPYTKRLMDCIPRMDRKVDRLDAIDGYVPHPTDFPKGCRFSTRCTEVMEKCHEFLPDLLYVEKDHAVRCWLYAEEKKSETTE